MSELIKKDEYYREWIQSISKEFRKSQLKAAVKVNEQMLQFYWILGRDISSMNSTSRYGTDFYNNVSKDLTELLPDVKSFSVTNLRYMVWFYELYSNALNLPQVGVEFETPIFKIPWGHNKLIIDKCKREYDKDIIRLAKSIINNGKIIESEVLVDGRNEQRYWIEIK